MEHSFNVQFAQKYGIEEAIIVHNFYFWIRKNIANNKHLHNGRHWTYNSNNAFCLLFPYINKTKIFRVLKNLCDENIILKDNFNANVWDKTLWYAFSDKGIAELSDCGYDVIDFVKMNHRDSHSETTIPYNKLTDIKTDIKEIDDKSSTKKDEDDDLFAVFESFAKEYKKINGKHTVSGIKSLFDDFKKRHKDWKDVIPLLMPALLEENKHRQEAENRKEFFPMPKNLSTYLGKQRAWESWVAEENTEIKQTNQRVINGQIYK